MKIKVAKRVDVLKNLKPKEETKPIKDKPKNQLRAGIIFDDLIKKRKELMTELYDSVDYNNLKSEYVGPTNDVSFYEHKDSEELFNTIKYTKIKFSQVKKKQNEILNKLSNIETGRKTKEQKEVIGNLENLSREEAINFF